MPTNQPLHSSMLASASPSPASALLDGSGSTTAQDALEARDALLTLPAGYEVRELIDEPVGRGVRCRFLWLEASTVPLLPAFRLDRGRQGVDVLVWNHEGVPVRWWDETLGTYKTMQAALSAVVGFMADLEDCANR